MAVDAIFCGNGTLLIQCAAAFREAGGVVRLIVTQDARVEEAAGALGVPVRHDWEPGDAGSVDYLFSVANLRVLPGEVLALARRMAVNFHDGPLPRFAGLNAPSWALIEGEASHAVTWHEMTEAVDAGRVLAERRFDILPTDTAFTLNARCYDAGLEAFRGMLPALLAGTLAGREQAGERRWYAGSRRPANLGLLDFGRPAGELERLVRALDFGGRANPLALPKVWTGEEVVVVRRLAMGEATGAGPGTVLRAEGDVLAVAAGDRIVELSGLTDLSGRAVEAGRFASLVGWRLPPVEALDPETLRAVGKAERRWEEPLRSADPALPPHPGRDGGDRGAASAALPEVPDGVLLAGYLAWVAGLAGKAALTVCERRGARHPALSVLRPVSVGMIGGETVSAMVERVAELLSAARDAGPMAGDLALRLETPEARERALGALRVVFAEEGGDEEVLGEAEVALALGPPRLVVRRGRYDEGVLRRIGEQLSEFLRGFAAADADRAVETLSLSGVGFTGSIEEPSAPDPLVHEAIAEQARRRPEAPALEAGAVSLTRGELDAAAGRLAGALAARGAGPGRVVGICLERGADLVVAMLAVLRTGAAYLPLDPDYPADRIAFMVEDAGAELIVASESAAARHGLDPARVVDPKKGDAAPVSAAGPDDLAYLIYTSGSTGRPKGVMVPHRAVANFLMGMDAVVPIAEESRLLAVTSVSFDIAVLEILWTLARGATVVLQVEAASAARPDFSLFYFASESSGGGHEAYGLLIEGAKFADANGFEAVWTPERHFHAFGGLYPNPAVSLAALSTITRNVKLRAGSVVAPLHHPVRLAEDWALVDNLSNGRAGLAFASGWQPNDFLLRPESFAERKAVMLDTLGIVRRLWAGERVAFPGHDGGPVEVEIHPKPVQATLPVWLTAAGNPETFVEAGRLGCGVLTHLLGQSFEEVSRKVAAYRAAWREAGHEGRGHVVLMLHTFIGDSEEEVLRLAQGPMKAYMKSAVDLIRRASWSFPTIVQRAEAEGTTPAAMFEREALSAEDLDQLLEHAFARYHRRAGLFGTPESAAEVVRQAAEAGADEIGCLIDFGIDSEVVLDSLPNLRALMEGLERRGGATRQASVAEEVLEKRITHLQCTPSLASYLAADAPGHMALARLEVLMVGGEPLLPELARALREGCGGRLLNMYGPTETTVWSTVARLEGVGERVPLGEPIRNTLLSVRSPDGRDLPDLVPGELWIGGAGVTAGYWWRPELTAEKFVTGPEGRFYRTGDLVRRTAEGALEFLGRIDTQVKVRGHRIELGEVEAALGAQPSVRQAVVTAREFGPGDTRLIGFVTGFSERPDPAVLLEALARVLPAAMVPSQVVALDRMPLLPNGKVDRRALVPPSPAAAPAPVAEAPDEVQGKVEGVWKRVLNLEAVALDDNFFDLGGHSLLVVQVQRQLRELFGAEVSITDVFRFPTVRALARHIGGLGGAEPSPASRGAARGAMRRLRMGRDGAQRQPSEDA